MLKICNHHSSWNAHNEALWLLTFWEIWIKIQEKCIWKCHLWNGQKFFSPSKCSNWITICHHWLHQIFWSGQFLPQPVTTSYILFAGDHSAVTGSIQYAGLILGLSPANERRYYSVTTSLTGWAQAQSMGCCGLAASGAATDHRVVAGKASLFPCIK